jgi:hypothetical protein
MWVQGQLMLEEEFLLLWLPFLDLPTVIVTVWLPVVVPYPSLEVKLLPPRPFFVVSDPQPIGGIIQTTVTEMTYTKQNMLTETDVWCIKQLFNCRYKY